MIKEIMDGKEITQDTTDISEILLTDMLEVSKSLIL
jgi:hypothetical protein